MAHISVNDAQPGMVVDSDVVATGNRLLLRSGSELTEAHLRTLRMWDVFSVDVRGVTREDVETRAAHRLDPTTRSEVEARLDILFARADRAHPMMDELVHVTRLRLYREVGGGSHDA